MAIKRNKMLKTNLKLRMFSGFLLLAILFWLLINLSKTYTNEILFNVRYVDLPSDKEIQNTPPSEITASVESTGFNLLKLMVNTNTLDVDISNLAYKNGSMFYYLPNRHLFEISSQLNVGARVDKFKLDTIFIDLGSNVSKRIPVKLNTNIEFKVGYNFTDEFLVMPDSVTILGPESIVDSITELNTQLLELTDVSEDISTTLQLDQNNSSKISLSTSEVTVKAEVDKFTEGTFTLPFKVLNTPEDVSIATFPSEVDVIYQIGLSNFKKITANDFEVYCDFAYSKENGLNYLVPKITTVSGLITNVKIVPDKIEFLIQK